MLKYLLCWFPMLLIAIANGAARDLWYKKTIGELTAHQVSTVSLLLLFSFYIWLVIKKLPPATASQAMLIGAYWLVLTLLFEFGFGLLRGNSLDKLLADYHVLKGRIWILIPLWTTVAPYLFFRWLYSG